MGACRDAPVVLLTRNFKEDSMPITVSLVLYIAAFVCFLVSAFGVSVKRVNLQSLGLALWVLGVILVGVR